MASPPSQVHARRVRAGHAVCLLTAVAAVLVAVGGRDAPAQATEAGGTARDANRPHASRPPRDRPVVLAFAGDVHFEGVVGVKLEHDAASVLAPMATILRRADLAMVNLETAVTDRGLATAKQYAFRSPASAFTALRAGGVDVATLANNHGMDFGETGLLDSLAAARRHRFPVVGIGLDARQAYAAHRVRIRGQRIAILGATQVLDETLVAEWTAGPRKSGLASAKDAPRLLQAVRTARAHADTVVVFLHWGEELTGCPTDDQRALARRLVAAGADVVVGSHAHRLLAAGRIRRGLVAFGLGNFAFYASSPVTTTTGVLKVAVAGRKVLRYWWVPARIHRGSPFPLGGSERRRAVADWAALRGCTSLRP